MDAEVLLPMDVLQEVAMHVSDPATLVRLAAACKLLRVVIKAPAFLDRLRRRHRDHGFVPSLLLGFFYQDSSAAPVDSWQYNEDRRRCLAPRFVPTSDLARFVVDGAGGKAPNPRSLAAFMPRFGAGVNFYDPVASQDGFLVLRGPWLNLSYAVPVLLRVCNPLTGEMHYLPPLPYVWPDQYVLLVDDGVGRGLPHAFQLVAVWFVQKQLIYRTYCSKTTEWEVPPGAPELMPSLAVRMRSPAAALRDVVHWLCSNCQNMKLTHVATLRVDTAELLLLELPLKERCDIRGSAIPVLSNSANGRLCLLAMNGPRLSLWRHDAKSCDAAGWALSETVDMASSPPPRVFKTKTKVVLEAFRGKSGAVLLWSEGEGLFLYSLGDRTMSKIGKERYIKNFLCLYEMDWLSCLAAMNLVDCSSPSPADEQMKTVRGRWRQLPGSAK